MMLGIFTSTLSLAHGYQTKPWFEEDLVPKYTLSFYGDGFSCVPTRTRNAAVDGWMAGIGNACRITILNDYALEGELLASLSACRDASLEAFRFTARTLLTSDTVGDAFASTVGVSFTAPSNQALRDINRFYYGRYAWELHYAIGRELAPDADWLQRTWAVGTVGLANQGSPWLRLHLAWERRICLTQRYELFATGEIGLGNHAFPLRSIRSECHHGRCCPRHFRGYAPLRYRVIDMGVSYTKEFEELGELSLHYTFRAYAYNLPGQLQALCVSLTVPFSL